MLKKYSTRSSVETGRAAGDAASCVSTDARTHHPSKQRAREQVQFACPLKARSEAILPLFFFSGAWIQKQRSVVSDLAEVKHLVDGVGERIERTLANALAAQPVVFDEADDRSLVGHAVVHEVLPRPRGDDQQRLSCAVTATAQRMRVRRVHARQRSRRR